MKRRSLESTRCVPGRANWGEPLPRLTGPHVMVPSVRVKAFLYGWLAPAGAGGGGGALSPLPGALGEGTRSMRAPLPREAEQVPGMSPLPAPIGKEHCLSAKPKECFPFVEKYLACQL